MDKNKLELKLKDADILALAIDVAVQDGRLNARSLIADTRLNYGVPWNYGHLTVKEVLYWKKRFSAKA